MTALREQHPNADRSRSDPADRHCVLNLTESGPRLGCHRRVRQSSHGVQFNQVHAGRKRIEPHATVGLAQAPRNPYWRLDSAVQLGRED